MHFAVFFTTLFSLPALLSAAPTEHAASSPKSCRLPAPGEPFRTATPEEANLDSADVTAAVAYAQSHNRLSLQILRNGCRIATGLLDPISDKVPNNIWSCTKSITSILIGIAQDMGALHVNDTIDQYLPTEPGWGDTKHRQLTILELLTETAGLREAILSEAATVVTERSAPQIGLAQPFTHEPGTFFEYTQRVPDILAYVIGRAVGMDLQDFAQEYLFNPIGIPRDSFFWLRDRSGNTYGYAWMWMPPEQLAKLGLLMQYNGNWNGKQILSADYISQATAPTQKNPYYSWLFWNNEATTCTGANIPAAQTLSRQAIPAAPADLYAMVGALQQNNFIIPSLDMLVTWTGVLGDYTLNLGELLSATPGPLYNNFFSLLMKSVKHRPLPDVGFLPPDALNFDVTPTNYFEPAILVSNVLTNPTCNIVFCDGTVPTLGLLKNPESILGPVGGTAKKFIAGRL